MATLRDATQPATAVQAQTVSGGTPVWSAQGGYAQDNRLFPTNVGAPEPVPSGQSAILAALHPRGSITTSPIAQAPQQDRLVPTGQISTAYTQFQGKAPEYGDAPIYTAPEGWTPREQAREEQKAAGLGIREARRSLRESTAGLGSDPASAYAMRHALAQHGINIERTLTGARETAYIKEQADLTRKTDEARIQHQTTLQEQANKYQAAWNTWLSTGRTVQTSVTQFTPESAIREGTSLRGVGISTPSAQLNRDSTDLLLDQISMAYRG